jgi:predicted PurR-regulated permease PerM
MIVNKKIPNYIVATLLIILTIITFLIIKPYITAILTSIILAYIFYPLHKRLYQKIKFKSLSAILIIILATLIFLIPFIFISQTLTQEVYNLYKSGQIPAILETVQSAIGENPTLSIYIDDAIRKATSYLTSYLSDFILSLPSRILDLFIIIFVMFFLLKDYEKIKENFQKVKIIKNHYKEKFISQFRAVTNSIIYGWFIVALVQGFLGGLAFFIFGISNPVFWGIAMAILSLLPYVGATIVWLPGGLWLIYTDSTTKGILLLLYGTLIIATSDNLIRAYIIGKKTRMHTAIIFLGIIGGLKFIGLIGIVIGPLVLSWFLLAIKIYIDEYNKIKA